MSPQPRTTWRTVSLACLWLWARKRRSSMSIAATTVVFEPSACVPLALGFFGLGTGYLIYGPQELAGFPRRNRTVDITTGIWGIWMPGFLQFITGVLPFVGLTWFDSFKL